MADSEIKREKTFSEELPYFKEQMREVFDYYDNPMGCSEMLYISVLNDSNRIVRKAEEEINHQQEEIEKLKKEIDSYDVFYFCSYSGCESASTDCWKTCPNSIYNKTRTEAYKEFAEKLENKINCRTTLSRQQDKNVIHIIHNLLKEMVGE